MTALAANVLLDEKRGDLVAHPMAVDIAYKGAMLKHNAAGFLAPCAAEAGAKFAGIAYEQVDNSGGSAGDIKCRAIKNGRFLFTASGFNQTDVGEKVYATDDSLITVTYAENIQWVGVIDEYVSSTQVWVKIDAAVENFDDVLSSEIHLEEGKFFVGNASDISVGVDMSGDATIDNAGALTIGNAKILLAMLSTGIKPSHIVVFAGEFTTAGGDATETINAPGILATDLVHVTMFSDGTTPRTIIEAAAITDNITVIMSDDPSTDHVLTYSVLRAVA